MTEYRLYRYISVFEQQGDDHVRDIEFVLVPNLAFLQALFKVPDDNPMFDVFAIDTRIAEQLTPYISERLDLERFDYYLECDSA
ncbi:MULTISPECIES: hypothetical protein [unclassified Caballeronia]|uniref:DUF7683 domain-containing protein n=1 Tax=unclassified Caballeronia TaxID=2646786 RepID=UPI002863A04E|nr:MULTISPECIES: hypothetical protein [unclassified Caballeronia]MDR5776639.1 hypothetical protein [Caballeronia sp. LZ002]MDR5852076.1 hypothetical protein [Caballeronia sp. LZ003]